MMTRSVVTVVVAALLAYTSPAWGQDTVSETVLFPEAHDTTFGPPRPFGDFVWFAMGHGARGRRILNQRIVKVTGVSVELFFGPSCVFEPFFQAPPLEVYVNDRKLLEIGLPAQVDCNTVPAKVTGSIDLTQGFGGPTFVPFVEGVGTHGNEYELRVQLQRSLTCCPGDLAVFYTIDTSLSRVTLTGSLPPEPPPPPPPPPDPHPPILAAVQQVLDALGRLDQHLMTSTEGLSVAIAANGLAIGAVSDAVRGVSERVAGVRGAVADVHGALVALADMLTRKIAADEVSRLAQALASGDRAHDFFRPDGIKPVGPFVGDAIALVEALGLRAPPVVRKARDEHARGLQRLASGAWFEAYALFERAYQTLVEGNVGLGR